jgi:dUTP pyrophosphatase
MTLQVPVRILRPGARLPERAYEHDAAFDLCSAVDVTVAPQQRVTVPTGIAIGLPPDVAALTLPRSGLAARHGLTIVNAPGLIDPGYRGEIQIVLLNTDIATPLEILTGDRIAQLLLVGLTPARLVEVDALPESDRGERGFGSSGA